MTFIKYSIQTELAYPKNFIISVLVEFTYQASFLAFFLIIYSKTQTLGGWDVNQMVILAGIDTTTRELFTGLLVVWNLRFIPDKVWSGELDRILLKPIHPLFTLSFGRPYFAPLVSAISGVIIAIYGISRANIVINPLWLLGSILFFILGFIIAYCFIMFFGLLTFFFQDSITLPLIGEKVLYNFSSRPQTIYTGALKIVFYFILPVVYVSSFSTSSLINGIDWLYLLIAFVLTIIFLLILRFVWKKAISQYSSASS